jgi:hypothetical protein
MKQVLTGMSGSGNANLKAPNVCTSHGCKNAGEGRIRLRLPHKWESAMNNCHKAGVGRRIRSYDFVTKPHSNRRNKVRVTVDDVGEVKYNMWG